MALWLFMYMMTLIQCMKIDTLFQNTNLLNNVLKMTFKDYSNTKYLLNEWNSSAKDVNYQVILVMTSTTYCLSLING